ncbi:alpha-hydroxy-acid oxidizing protein [Desulfovibrio sp. OttesenSCG-928-O18]|nr:alpha-hydroxy-acid oxidizing protein [Desulfovibrio sp. OttesenSCG-928-O18]
MQTIRETARGLLKGSCRVCPVCDGRACAGEVPGMGGLGTGAAFKNNVRALADLDLNMRLIHEVKEPQTGVSWLGLELAMPVVAAPIGGKFNFNNAMPEEEYAAAVVAGSNAAGVVGCTGDGVPPEIVGGGFDAIIAAKGRGIPFVKPWEGAELDEKLGRALASGAPVIGMDVDAAGLITLRKMGRPVAPKSLKELSAIIDTVHKGGAKFIVKGVMTVSDACLAVEAGADCIVVSNHGGRVLPSCPGTAEVLPGIAEAVRGKISIMVDGGVRNGFDVMKMLALGADVVGIGRPVTIAAVGGRADGVATYFNTVKAELTQAMVLTGCQTVKDITESVLFSG